jgi:hypothetical protein
MATGNDRQLAPKLGGINGRGFESSKFPRRFVRPAGPLKPRFEKIGTDTHGTTLGESIHPQADSVEELHARVRDAVRCHFEDGTAPKMIRLRFVRDEIIAG